MIAPQTSLSGANKSPIQTSFELPENIKENPIDARNINAKVTGFNIKAL
jgi:hypothetical protein